MPVPPLDGGTAWRLLSRGQRWLLVGVVAATLYASGEGMLWLVLLAAVGRAMLDASTGPADWRAFLAWTLLIGALAAVSVVRVPLPLP